MGWRGRTLPDSPHAISSRVQARPMQTHAVFVLQTSHTLSSTLYYPPPLSRPYNTTNV